uniref:Uncharacterized protein n=1 Tax=Arundo donax TaxID=35708 RepID=A0A0A9QRQ5_ARUDO
MEKEKTGDNTFTLTEKVKGR